MLKILKIIILVIIALLAIPFVIWNITFGFIIGYLLLILMLLGLYFSIKKTQLKPVMIALLTGLIMYVFMLPLTTRKMNTKTASYQERVSNGSHLNVIEKFNIYGIYIIASTVAYPFFPEASTEFLYMMVPTKNGVREFESDFFMKSKKLVNAFNKSNKGTVSWQQKHYNITHSESRTALALNICTYKILKTKKSTKYVVSVPIRFPKKCRSTFFKNDILTIRAEEGLFRYLEEQGWLFGYNAVWTHSEIN
jgi:hypothetical protein